MQSVANAALTVVFFVGFLACCGGGLYTLAWFLDAVTDRVARCFHLHREIAAFLRRRYLVDSADVPRWVLAALVDRCERTAEAAEITTADADAVRRAKALLYRASPRG